MLNATALERVKWTAGILWLVEDYNPQQILIHSVQQAWLIVFLVFYNTSDLQEPDPGNIMIILTWPLTCSNFPKKQENEEIMP